LERIALEYNPTLVQAQMAVRAAQGKWLQAGLYPNPAALYVGDEIGNDGLSGLQGGGFSQEIVTHQKLRLGRAVASREIQEARHALEAQEWRVLNDVRAGYYEVLVAQKRVEVNEQLVRVGQEALRITERLRAAGEVGEADVLQARIEYEKARLDRDEAQTRRLSAWRQLAAVLGRPEMEPRPLHGDLNAELPDFEWRETLAQLLAQSPEAAQARAAVERARCELARQCAERWPNFEVGVVGKYDPGSELAVADVGITLPLPLFNRNQGNIAKARAEYLAAQEEVRRVELELHDRLARAFEQYDVARRRVEAYTKTILPQAEKSLRLVRVGYEEGEYGYLALLTAQRTLFGVSLEYLANLRELWARSVELRGMLLRGGLQAAARSE
jgi:cobalt-zinc-cadmium efflux system outer membrane protein